MAVPGVQIVRKGAKNRATARRTASEKGGETGERSPLPFPFFPLFSFARNYSRRSRLFAPFPLSERQRKLTIVYRG